MTQTTLNQAEQWLSDRCEAGSEYAKVIQAELDRLRYEIASLKPKPKEDATEKPVKVNPARRKHPIFNAQIIDRR